MHDFLDRRCDKLSTGMKQKTSIARMLVHDPQVMIFDEPTLGLDVMTARAIVQFVRECRERGKTVIYSTHVMSEAEKLCDVIGIIHGGRLRAEGTLAELRARTGERTSRSASSRSSRRDSRHERAHHRHDLRQGARGLAARPAHAGLDDRHADAPHALLILGVGKTRLDRSSPRPARRSRGSWWSGAPIRPASGPSSRSRASSGSRRPPPTGRPHLGQEGARRGRDPRGLREGARVGLGPAVTLYDYEGELKSGMAAEPAEDLLCRPARPRDGEAAGRPRPARVDRAAVRGGGRPTSPRRRRRAGTCWGASSLHHHHLLLHRGHVPGDGPRRRREGEGHDGDAPVQPRLRTDIVLGKFLMVLTGSLAAVVCSLVSLGSRSRSWALRFRRARGRRRRAGARDRPAGHPRRPRDGDPGRPCSSPRSSSRSRSSRRATRRRRATRPAGVPRHHSRRDRHPPRDRPQPAPGAGAHAQHIAWSARRCSPACGTGATSPRSSAPRRSTRRCALALAVRMFRREDVLFRRSSPKAGGLAVNARKRVRPRILSIGNRM
jgi:hypothetical protein